MNRLRGMPLNPETREEAEAARTPEGMRKRLNEYARQGNEPIVRQVFCLAEINGLSGEDKMTVLAFEALKALEHCKDLILEQVSLSPAPIIIRKGA